ncbi:dihydrofolate reductase [Shouchella shacheensis]|uniref:dihydrofolate reductase n=1 Tax=Shouchella shacheensis TaxID=1649580 RepID=UPI00074002F8|nr:dihydrofolate reductase [Shouchella shacheensis]
MISFVYAMDQERAIGKNNELPWYLPADLRHFKQVTTGHTIVMGRKTYQSIGKPLPNRKNVVLTRDANFTAEGVKVIHSKKELLDLASSEEETFVIGGAELFKLLWDVSDKQYVTVIEHVFDGDTFAPGIDERKWELVESVRGTMDEKNRYPHEFRTYIRH